MREKSGKKFAGTGSWATLFFIVNFSHPLFCFNELEINPFALQKFHTTT